jgi:prophage regulatory protein
MINTILRLPAVKARTGLSRSTIYLRISEGRFPKPILLGGARAVGWLESAISEWVEAQIKRSRTEANEVRR